MEDIQSWRNYCEGIDYHDLPFYPETGGVLPFGRLDNGDTLGWVVNGIPDNGRAYCSRIWAKKMIHFSPTLQPVNFFSDY